MSQVKYLIEKLEKLTNKKVSLKEFTNYDLQGETLFNAKKLSLLFEYIAFIWEELELYSTKPVMIEFTVDRTDPSLRTTAYYDDVSSKTVICIKNRALVDIFRSLGHELTHKKQHAGGSFVLPQPKMEEGGSFNGPIEDEANLTAGRLVRSFGEIHPEIYDEGCLE